jgi:PAS domain S-box-containing protein
VNTPRDIIDRVSQPRVAPDDQRLTLLRATGLLDSPREPQFDNLASLAASVCAAPVAAMTLLDRSRQWFKASVGLDARETGLAQSLCVRLLSGESELVIDNLRANDELREHPAASSFASYAGVAIDVRGQRIGACCVADYRPRQWSLSQLAAMRMLAQQAAALIEARLVNDSLHAAEAQLLGSLDTQEEMLGRLDTDLRIIFANNALCRALGLAREQLLGRSVLEFSPAPEHENIRDHFATIRRERHAGTLEQTIVDAGGVARTHRWTDSPLFDTKGSCLGYQSWGWDVTDIRARERALQEATTQALRTNEALRARNAEILQLTYALTHDLQTPLATLTGQLSLLERAIEQGANPGRSLERSRASVQRLTRMLTDLMTYARAGHEEPRCERVDLAEVARSVADELGQSAFEQRVQLSLDELSLQRCAALAGVQADREALRRCVVNLVSNALKYTAQKQVGTKLVSVALVSEGARIRLCVRDTGPGIPPAQLEAVFLPFKRVSPDASGTGLGLSIVKRYAEMFGGRVWLESDGQTGTLATLELPRAIVATSQAA